LHKEALACLKKGDDAPTRKQGKKLLRRAITEDPKFLPARLTLIAIQLYQEQNYQDASTTIQEAQAIFPRETRSSKYGTGCNGDEIKFGPHGAGWILCYDVPWRLH
jgi:Tfp pilus assembly protein PilF